jgi:outer membrane receptor for ferrienterochelin and colicins
VIVHGLLLAILLSAAGQGQAKREATARAQAIAVSGGPEALTAAIAAELADLGRFEDRVLEGRFGHALKHFPQEATAAFTQQDYEIQLNLLTYSWDRFAFAAMEPVLGALYRSPPDDSARVRDMALRRLYQLNPVTARPLMLQELQRGDLRVSMTTLRLLPDAEFPDFEEAWTRALEHGVLDERIDAAVRIERFGSASILPAVRRVYSAQSSAWSCDLRVAALAYLAKHDRAAASPLIVDARMSCPDEVQAHPVLKQAPVEFEEEIIVTAARTGGRLDDQPTRVEVLDREEIEEKMMMTPGDIVMMLNEMGGLRVQSTSPSLGAASVRIQGMDGRYTRVLFDGLPLAGQQVGGLGLLQIPPMDLAQVEVIKGVASASYGAGALGGVINLVARRPAKPVVEALLNQSTIAATDGVVFAARQLTDVLNATLLAGAHYQARNDVDDDEWIDVAGYARGVFRPRVFWSDDRGNGGSATVGVTLESRQGGPAGGSALESRIGGPESIDTTRADAGLVVNRIIRDRYFMTARLAATYQRHDHLFYVVRERDRHTNVFGEVALRGAAGRHTWVGGVAYERESLNPLDVPQFEYFHRAPGVFGQDDFQWFDWLTLSAGARLDVHHTYGSRISPRVAALARWNGWTSRIAAGGGFFASTPLTEQTEAAGLSRLSMPEPLRKETGSSYSIDVTRALGDVTITGTFFASLVSDPVHVERDAAYVIGNAAGPTTHRGVEMLGTYRRAPYSLTANYTFVRAREDLNGTRVESALTPAHALSLVGMWEREGWGRVGIEYYFTGAQRLESNPFRDRSEPYSIIGVLAERAFDRVRVFVNLENLTGVRQTNYDPLVKPAPAADGRWSVDGWAPLDGRTLNAGLRVTF